MMKKTALALVIMTGLTITACQQGAGTKQTIGTGAGALGGGLLGSQVGSGSGRLWATGAGVLIGALTGSEIGASLDRADRTYMQQAQQRSYNAPVGEKIYWDNPQSGNRGYYAPTRQGRSAGGDYCREFQQVVTVGGSTENAYGVVCQRPDGSWEIMD